MKKQFVKAASAAKMLDAFENKLAEMKGDDIESATDIPKPTSSVALTPEQEDLLWEIDGRYDNVDVADEEIPTVIAEIYKAIIKEVGLSDRDARRVMIDILGYNPDDVPVELESSTDVSCGYALHTGRDENEWYIDTNGQFTGTPGELVSKADLIDYWNENLVSDPTLEGDLEGWLAHTLEFMEPVDASSEELDEYDEPVLGEEPIQAGLFDDYFGKDKAEQFGDLIAENLAGQTVSKRKDLAEEPGGLIYEANLLGIDMWDLLEALEGMCYQGRAMEIDDSTYKIK